MSFLTSFKMDQKRKNGPTLDVRGDLNLSNINFPKFPKNVTVSEELNDYLRGQLDQMKKENEMLREDLSQKESQIHRSQTKIEELSEKVINYEGCVKNEFTSSSQVANSKIVELSKKLRERNSEVEVYKSKCANLESALSELTAKSEKENEIDKDNFVAEPDETKKLQDKLNYTTNKWIEEKNLNLRLKNDLKLANKWLQQEVGDKFETLLNINNSSSSWRGRAQIICDLQQKNQEMREKLKAYQENIKDKQSYNTETDQVKYDKKIETLNRENSELKNNFAELKRKFEVVKARRKVLENEYGLLKTKVAKLNEVHETDQHTLAKLRSQMECHNDLKREDLRQKDQIIKNLQQENELLKMEIMKEKCVSENKSKELLEKNDDIQKLNKRIRSSRPTSSYNHRPDNPEVKTLNRLEVERLRLLELTEIQNSRLEEERNAHLKTQYFLRIEKQKCAKLEANLARSQLEYNSARSGYTSKSNTPKQIDYDIKDKLELAEENIKALTTRLEIESLERKRDLQEFSKILKNYNVQFEI